MRAAPFPAQVWDLEAGKETLTLRGHARGVSSLAFAAEEAGPVVARNCRGFHAISNCQASWLVTTTDFKRP